MSTALEFALEECVELLTEGGNDAGVDGVHIGDVDADGFLATLFQGKYKIRDLSGTANSRRQECSLPSRPSRCCSTRSGRSL